MLKWCERRLDWTAGGGGAALPLVHRHVAMKSSFFGGVLLIFLFMISNTVNLAKPNSELFCVQRVRPFIPVVPLNDHHFLASRTNQVLHFPKLREQENLLEKQKQLEEIRRQAVQKRATKLTAVEHFEECCSRFRAPNPAKNLFASNVTCDCFCMLVFQEMLDRTNS